MHEEKACFLHFTQAEVHSVFACSHPNKIWFLCWLSKLKLNEFCICLLLVSCALWRYPRSMFHYTFNSLTAKVKGAQVSL